MEANKKFIQEVKRLKNVRLKKIVSIIAVAVMVFAMSTVAFATETTTAATLTIDFDVETMFSWTQIIISALMPVVYVLMGIGLGFLIINNLKNAFVGSMH